MLVPVSARRIPKPRSSMASPAKVSAPDPCAQIASVITPDPSVSVVAFDIVRFAYVGVVSVEFVHVAPASELVVQSEAVPLSVAAIASGEVFVIINPAILPRGAFQAPVELSERSPVKPETVKELLLLIVACRAAPQESLPRIPFPSPSLV